MHRSEPHPFRFKRELCKHRKPCAPQSKVLSLKNIFPKLFPCNACTSSPLCQTGPCEAAAAGLHAEIDQALLAPASDAKIPKSENETGIGQHQPDIGRCCKGLVSSRTCSLHTPSMTSIGSKLSERNAVGPQYSCVGRFLEVSGSIREFEACIELY